MTIDPADQMLSTNEVAQLLAVDRKTIERMRDRGDLVAVKIGPKLIRYRRADVLRLLEEGTTA